MKSVYSQKLDWLLNRIKKSVHHNIVSDGHESGKIYMCYDTKYLSIISFV